MLLRNSIPLAYYSKFYLKSLFLSSGLIAPGFYIYHRHQPTAQSEEDWFKDYILSFGESDFDMRADKIDNDETRGKWVKMHWEKDYDWVEALKAWKDNIRRYNTHDRREETMLYKYMNYASNPFNGKVALPEAKGWAGEDMNLRKIIFLCNRLWTQERPNQTRIRSARGWCTDARKPEGEMGNKTSNKNSP